MFNVKRLAKYLATGVMPEMTALDESLAEHDKKYHPDGYKEGDECNKRETMAGGDGVDKVEGQRSEVKQRKYSSSERDNGVTAEEDAAYLDAVKRGDMETARRMVREAAAKAMPNAKFRDKDGSPLQLYHGTPSGGFNRFKTDTVYLSPDKNYAKRYESPSASSIRFGKQATNPMTMAVYAFSQRPFDTRKADSRRAFYDKYIQGGEEWNPTSGSYTKLSRRSLPDWTEAENLRDFLVATRRKNDAIVVDEGGYFDMNGNVVDRGISYVVIDPKIIKSADPVTYDDAGQPIPLSRRFDFTSDDIRY